MKIGEFLPFLGRFGNRYRYPFGAVPVLLMQKQNGTDTAQIGTGTALQNRIDTGTDQSGTGTDGSCSPCYCYFCVFKLKFAY